MTIAWLMPEMPYPANTGGRLVLYHRLKYMSQRGHKIHLYATCKDSVSDEDMAVVTAMCSEVKLYDRESTKTESAFVSLMSGKPFAVQNRFFPDIDESIRDLHPDWIICEFPQMLMNLSPETCSKVRVVLEQHNIEWETTLSIADSFSGLTFGKMAHRREGKALYKYERALYKKRPVDIMTFVSEKDCKRFRFECSARKVSARPGGSDYFSPHDRLGHNVMFLANFSYEPNSHGALWLAREVMPSVFKEIPDAKLLLVGKEPTSEMRALAEEDSRIVVTGTVESLNEWYAKSDVVAIPIFEGGGIKMKALEAASAGRPIVASSPALIGTDLDVDSRALVADDAEDFASDIVDVLRDPERFEAMWQRARELFERTLSWDAANAVWYQNVFEGTQVS
jgi:glycosyltransferase involved in cell wall biosynthesis